MESASFYFEKEFDKMLFTFSQRLMFATLLTILQVPMTPTFSQWYYESQAGVPIGSRWYISIFFLSIVCILSIINSYHQEKNMLIALLRLGVSLLILFPYCILLCCLWEYGSLTHTPYFISYQIFFSSDIMVALLFGLLVSEVVGLIPKSSSP